METIVTIKEVGAFAERQYQNKEGKTEYFKSRGFVMKRGGDEIYGEMLGEMASKNRDTQYYQNTAYVVKGYWRRRAWQTEKGETRHENNLVITDLQQL